MASHYNVILLITIRCLVIYRVLSVSLLYYNDTDDE